MITAVTKFCHELTVHIQYTYIQCTTMLMFLVFSMQSETCVRMFSNAAFDDCDLRVPQDLYIKACVSDLCSCQNSSDASCFCDTLSEYSRQCTHAGGMPKNWRTGTMCGKYIFSWLFSLSMSFSKVVFHCR